MNTKRAGLCECGCGRQTPIAAETRQDRGYIKGQPLRFVRGHRSRLIGREIEDRFWSNVDWDLNAPGCWEWRGYVRPVGYGQFGRSMQAHRVAYELEIGEIPEGLQLDHLCRNRRCVNPDHLEPVTSLENTLRGESFIAKKAAQTHCIRGHPFDEENTIHLKKRGRRQCRACLKAPNTGRSHEPDTPN